MARWRAGRIWPGKDRGQTQVSEDPPNSLGTLEGRDQPQSPIAATTGEDIHREGTTHQVGPPVVTLWAFLKEALILFFGIDAPGGRIGLDE